MSLDVDKEIAAAHMEATGWGIDEYNQADVFGCHLIYVHDFRIHKLKLLSVSRQHFDNSNEVLRVEDTATALCYLLELSFKDNFSEEKINCLYGAAIEYVQQTKSYRLWKGQASFSERMHAVLNIYPGGGRATVRPFIMRSETTVIDAKSILETTLQVARTDAKNHPEWF